MPKHSSTVIRADHNSSFYRRFLLLAIAALVFMGFCLKDGFYAYPLQQERYREYTRLVDEGRGSEWESVATSREWSTEVPEKDRPDAEIASQFIMAGGCALVGGWLLFVVLSARGRWIESDGTKITTSWGQTVPFDAIESLDKKKWRNKGIAKVTYNDGGKVRKFAIDDFKFERDATDRILYALEQSIDVEKIIGGPPESASGASTEANSTEPDSTRPS